MPNKSLSVEEKIEFLISLYKKNLGQNNIIKEFLRKGGIRCEILTSANIKVGDEIKVP